MNTNCKTPGEVLVESLERTLLTKLDDVEYRVDQIEEFFRTLETESDRAVVIISHSFIDDRMKLAFEDVLNPKVTGGVNSLLTSNGPLATSSARIQLAAALFWLTPKTYKALNMIRKIRNLCAHDPFIRVFEDQRINGLINEIPDVEKSLRQSGFINEGQSVPSIRSIFLARMALTLSSLLVEMSSAPRASAFGLPPNALLTVEWSRLPKNIQQIWELGAKSAIKFLTSKI